MKIHIVQKGDTLWKIAKKYGVNFEELKQMNTQLSNPDMIMPGMKIKVPASGGSVKKEAPSFNMGAKKEMPKAEHPFAKEKPITKPVAETPKEMPIEPQKPAPVKQEKPKKPFMPKMPKPMMPDIDINNYYLMNLANIQTQQPAPQPKPMPQPKPVQQMPVQQLKPVQQMPAQQPKPVQPKPVEQIKPAEQPKHVMPKAVEKPMAAPTKPQLPPKPLNLFPQEKPVEMHESMNFPTNQGGNEQPMNPYQNGFYPGAPMAPGAGHQGGFPQAQMPYGQVQGMQSPQYGMMPGVESPSYEESSPFMAQQQLPLSPQAQMPAPVMGVEDYGQQLPLQPTYTAPAYQQPYYPCPPQQIYPVSPVMPGPGPGYCPPPMHYGYPQHYAPMPQVQGVMEEPNYAQMPLMPTESQMPLSPAQNQMPLMPSHSQMPLMPTAVQGAEADCGCGGGAPAGFAPQYQQPFVPGHAFPGAVPYGQPFGGFPQGQQMNPYGYGPMGGPAFGRPFDESSDFEG